MIFKKLFSKKVKTPLTTYVAGNNTVAVKPQGTTSILSSLPTGTLMPSQSLNGTMAAAGGGYSVTGLSAVGSGVYQPSYYSVGANPPSSIVSFTDQAGSEIVRLNLDGTVTWKKGIGTDIDIAAEAFSRLLRMSAEIRAGLTQTVKQEMRDSVFNDIIGIAKEKGSLTAEDLTYLLEASKIVEKLKGGYGDRY